MHGQLPHSFAVQCTMSEHKITKSMIVFQTHRTKYIDIDYAKIFLKNSFRLFFQIVLLQLVLVHQMMTKQILIWFLHDKKGIYYAQEIVSQASKKAFLEMCKTSESNILATNMIWQMQSVLAPPHLLLLKRKSERCDNASQGTFDFEFSRSEI